MYKSTKYQLIKYKIANLVANKKIMQIHAGWAHTARNLPTKKKKKKERTTTRCTFIRAVKQKSSEWMRFV